MRPSRRPLACAMALATVALLMTHTDRNVAQSRNTTLARPLALASMELDYRGAAVAAALKVKPGGTVATFGLTGRRFLFRLLDDLGPEGTVIVVCRNVHEYRALRDGTEFGARVKPIYAKDGDAHLEVGSADLMVIVDVSGFYTRWPDMLRQVRRILPPGGRLATLQLPPRDVLLGEAKPGDPAVDPSRMSLEAAGFRWVESPKVLTKRNFNVFQKPLPSTSAP